MARLSGTQLFVYIALAGVAGYFLLPYIFGGGTIAAVVQQPVTTEEGAIMDAAACPDTNTGALQVKVQNSENTTNPEFRAASYQIWKDGTKVVADTASASDAYDSNTITCPSAGKIYVVGEGTNSNSMATDYVLDRANVYKTLVSTKPSDVEIRLYDGFSNITGGDADSFNQDAYTSSNVTMGAGDSKEFIVDVRPTTSACAFGSDGGLNGVLVCTNAPLSYYDDGTVILMNSARSAISTISIPSGLAGTETKCWDIPAIKSSESYRRLYFAYKAKVNPGYSQSPRLKFYDYQYFTGSDNSIKFGVLDDSNTNVGATDRYTTIGIA